MKDSQKTKAQLIEELQTLRKESESYEDFLSGPLYQSTELMRLITENTAVNIGIITFDLKAKYVYVNSSVKTTLGYTPEELVGKSLFDFIHPDDKKALLPVLKRYLQKKVKKLFSGKESKISETVDFRFIDKSGHWRYLRSTVNIVGKYLLALTTDISAQKEVDLRLQEAAAQWEATFNAMSDSVSIIDTDGHIIRYNEATLKMFDISKLEMQSKQCWELVHKTSEPIENCPIVRMKQSGQPESMALQDGNRWLEISVDPVFDSAKSIIGAVHVVSDITDRKNAEKALLKNESKYRTLFEQSADALLIIKEGKFIDCNPATVSMLGYKSKKEFLNTHPSELSPETQSDGKESFTKANEMIEMALKNGSHRFEWQHKKRNGDVFPVEVLLTTISLEEEEFIHVVWRDISERKEAEEKVKKNAARLRRAELASKSGNWELDLKSGTITGSAGALAIYGLTGKEFNYKAIKNIPLAEYRPLLDAALNDLIQKQKPYQLEFKIKTADRGQEKYIYSRAQYDEENKIVFGIIQDITEFKQIQNALKDSEQKNRILIDMAPNGFFQGDSNGNLIRVNAKACELTGYSEEELLTFNLAELFDAESLREKPLRYDLLKKGVVLTSEREMRKKDGSRIYIEMNSRRMPDKTYQAFIRDISERKRAEKQLFESEERYRSLVEQMPDGVYRSTEDGRFIDVNPAMVRILGYKNKEELMNVDIRKDLYFENTEREIIVESLKLSGNRKIDTFRLRHKKGHEIWVEDHGRLITDENGKILYHEGVLRDITERKQAQERIARLAEFNKNIISSAPVGIITVNNKKQVTSANDTFLEMMDSPGLDEVVKIGIDLPIFSNENIRGFFRKALTQGQSFEIKQLPYTSYWGKELVIDLKGVPQKTEEGAIYGVIIVVNDVTKNVEAEEERKKLEIQLRRAQKLETIGTLAGGIAHDFNNILAPIMGFTELALLKVEESSPMARDLNQVLKGAYRAKELVEQILLFSKQSEKERRAVALQPLIDEALKLLRPSIPSTVEIRKDIDPTCRKIRADATQIHQIIVNLCTNAWHAMKEGGTLIIRLEQTTVDFRMSKMHPNLTEGVYVRLSIIDTGIGMDEETLDRIFEPFFTTKAVDKGTGLGLSVVHGIVRNHRGDILVYSEPGKGSAFHVYFPALLVETDEENQKNKIVPGGDESVLIVDDEPVIAEMVKTMLENFGYRAHIHKTGVEAVEAFERRPQNYDLLITDLTMPQMTGLDLADRLHETHPKLPVIIMTGFGDSLTKPTLKRYGIKQVIGKPVVVKELARAVRNALDT